MSEPAKKSRFRPETIERREKERQMKEELKTRLKMDQLEKKELEKMENRAQKAKAQPKKQVKSKVDSDADSDEYRINLITQNMSSAILSGISQAFQARDEAKSKRKAIQPAVAEPKKTEKRVAWQSKIHPELVVYSD